jgi:hypothetical protein
MLCHTHLQSKQVKKMAFEMLRVNEDLEEPLQEHKPERWSDGIRLATKIAMTRTQMTAH